jgi:hypothetical protein
VLNQFQNAPSDRAANNPHGSTDQHLNSAPAKVGHDPESSKSFCSPLKKNRGSLRLHSQTELLREMLNEFAVCRGRYIPKLEWS